MKASDYVVKLLCDRGVKHIFELSGGMICHLLDSAHKCEDVKLVSMCHEQAAAFAAEAAGRMTGTPGVAMATSGPGATNLLTGVGSCFFDSSPAVFITGQVNCREQKGDRPIRQLGFQECDIVSMARPITKAAWSVRHPDELPDILNRAFDLAIEGRPGPVLIDIPMDVQRAMIDLSSTTCQRQPFATTSDVDEQDLEEVFDALASAKRPLILAGGGLRAAGAIKEFRSFISCVRTPVVCSLMAIDAIPGNDPLRVGMIGSYGNRWANLAIGDADLILVLGSRLDVRQTGADVKTWKGQRTIIHVDCQSGEMNNRVSGCRTIVADLKSFLAAAATKSQSRRWPTRTAWRDRIESLKNAFPDTAELDETDSLNPNVFMRQLSAASQQASAYVVDVGQHQMWAAQSLQIGPSQRFITSGGMGAMGFALPAGIGAAFSTGAPVVVVAGDGGFQVNIQELETVVRNRLPIKIVVVNNRCHGMVRQFQESYFQQSYPSTLWGYSAPDFSAIAQSYGIEAQTLQDPQSAEEACRWLWRQPEQPALLQVMVSTTANAYPKIAYGEPMTKMEPRRILRSDGPHPAISKRSIAKQATLDSRITNDNSFDERK